MFSCQGLPFFRPLSPLKQFPSYFHVKDQPFVIPLVFSFFVVETFPFIIISMSRTNPSYYYYLFVSRATLLKTTFPLETVPFLFPCQGLTLPLAHNFPWNLSLPISMSRTNPSFRPLLSLKPFPSYFHVKDQPFFRPLLSLKAFLSCFHVKGYPPLDRFLP